MSAEAFDNRLGIYGVFLCDLFGGVHLRVHGDNVAWVELLLGFGFGDDDTLPLENATDGAAVAAEVFGKLVGGLAVSVCGYEGGDLFLAKRALLVLEYPVGFYFAVNIVFSG